MAERPAGRDVLTLRLRVAERPAECDVLTLQLRVAERPAGRDVSRDSRVKFLALQLTDMFMILSASIRKNHLANRITARRVLVLPCLAFWYPISTRKH